MFVLVIEKRPGIDQGYSGSWLADGHASNGIKVKGPTVGGLLINMHAALAKDDERLEMIAALDGGDDDSI